MKPNNIFRSSLVLVLLLMIFNPALSQRKTQTEDDLHDQSFSFGINFNTNGGLIGGATLRYSKRFKDRLYHSLNVEAVSVKHPKEQRLFDTSTGNISVYNKKNSLFTIRSMYGMEYVLFKKARERGIQVNALASTGPAFGIITPYSAGLESFSESISNAEVQVGLSGKISMIFELGVMKNSMSGFEAGYTFDLYPKEIVILEGAENKKTYSSVFLTFFFGGKK